MNVLLIGKMGSGKTEISKLLIKQGYRIHSVADWLKLTLDTHYNLDKLGKNDKVSIQGREYSKRELYQYFGTELIRTFDKDFHIDELIYNINFNKMMFTNYQPEAGSYKFCVDDVRFQNEIDKLKLYDKCIVIKLKCDESIRRERLLARDGSIDEARFSHISETGIDTLTYDVGLYTGSELRQVKRELIKILKEYN